MKIIFLPITMLGLALLSMPYGYYQLVRIVVCAISTLISYQLYNKNIKNWLFLGFVLIAILYNPIAKISLSKEIWWLLNILTIIYYGATYKLISKKINKLF